jgi:hypothetical protein
MDKPVRDNTQTRKRATETGTLVGTRFQADLLAKVDAWIGQQAPPFPTRPEAIRRLVEKALASE